MASTDDRAGEVERHVDGRYSLISNRWPSGSRRKHRVSAPCLSGAVRNSPPRPRSRSYVSGQFSTLIVNRLSRTFGSAGGARVTSGLSSVGAPPSTSSSQAPPKLRTTDDAYSRYTVAPSTSVY